MRLMLRVRLMIGRGSVLAELGGGIEASLSHFSSLRLLRFAWESQADAVVRHYFDGEVRYTL
jgi:hypothetical protein